MTDVELWTRDCGSPDLHSYVRCLFHFIQKFSQVFPIDANLCFETTFQRQILNITQLQSTFKFLQNKTSDQFIKTLCIVID